MAKQILITLLLALTMKGYSQTKKDKIKYIGISIPVIRNNSEGTYYILGTRKEPTGNGTSYGINISYSRTIYKNLFGIAGIGYFKQAFGIMRPFDYVAPDRTKPLVSAKTYSYNTLHFIIGMGYQQRLNKALTIKGIISYNLYNSYRQKYNPANSFYYHQINHKSIALGNMINLTTGVQRKFTKRISAGLDLLLPLSTHWNDDEMFFNLGYSDDSQQAGRTKFSIGTQISCVYNF